MNKVPELKFCHDYQNGGCFRAHCKYLHSSRQDEYLHMRTGVLPKVLEDRWEDEISSRPINMYIKRTRLKKPVPAPLPTAGPSTSNAAIGVISPVLARPTPPPPPPTTSIAAIRVQTPLFTRPPPTPLPMSTSVASIWVNPPLIARPPPPPPPPPPAVSPFRMNRTIFARPPLPPPLHPPLRPPLHPPLPPPPPPPPLYAVSPAQFCTRMPPPLPTNSGALKRSADCDVAGPSKVRKPEGSTEGVHHCNILEIEKEIKMIREKTQTIECRREYLSYEYEMASKVYEMDEVFIVSCIALIEVVNEILEEMNEQLQLSDVTTYFIKLPSKFPKLEEHLRNIANIILPKIKNKFRKEHALNANEHAICKPSVAVESPPNNIILELKTPQQQLRMEETHSSNSKLPKSPQQSGQQEMRGRYPNTVKQPVSQLPKSPPQTAQQQKMRNTSMRFQTPQVRARPELWNRNPTHVGIRSENPPRANMWAEGSRLMQQTGTSTGMWPYSPQLAEQREQWSRYLMPPEAVQGRTELWGTHPTNMLHTYMQPEGPHFSGQQELWGIYPANTNMGPPGPPPSERPQILTHPTYSTNTNMQLQTPKEVQQEQRGNNPNNTTETVQRWAGSK